MRIEQGGNTPHQLSTTYNTKHTSHHIQQLQQQQRRQHKRQQQHTNGEEHTNNNSNHSEGEEEDMFLYKNNQTTRPTSEEIECPMNRSDFQNNYQSNQRCQGEFKA